MQIWKIAVALGAIGTGGPIHAATLIDDTSLAYYNAGIGTVLDGTNPFGGNYMFPLANIAGGDPSLDIPASTAPDLSAAASALGSWLSDPGNPGGSWSAAPVAIPTGWAINSETAIIYEIDGGTDGLSDVVASFGVDNGVFVWLNGAFLGGHVRDGGVSAGEFSLALGDLAAGKSYLQILREDHGGVTGYTVSVTGDYAAPAAVPLPASGLLLIAVLAGLTTLRRRKG